MSGQKNIKPLLLVDDDESILLFLSMLFEHRGYEILKAMNGLKAKILLIKMK